jgi:plasmid stabilization system protein ParE
VSNGQLPIKWDRLAKQSLDEIYEYIAANESQAVAKRVKAELVRLAENLNPYPRKFPEEPILKEEEEEY